MTFNPKPLSIMRKVYEKKQIEVDSLLSPPLTPIETTYSPVTDNVTFYSYPKSRKSFIESYCRMAPLLKPENHGLDDRIFSLNVYRDLLNKKKAEEKINNGMLNKSVVVPSKKRKLSVSKDKQPSYKKTRVSSVLPTGKDAASAFDSIDIESTDLDFFPSRWLPSRQSLDFIPVRVHWKGAPLSINQQPLYHLLHPVEATMASTLRLSPTQYLRCKRTLIMAARTLKYQNIPFTKSVAQKLCRVDVNKTSALWTAFGQLGWLDESD